MAATTSPDMDEISRLVDTVFHLNNHLIAERDALVKDLGLTSARWQVLEALDRDPAHPTVSQIARRLGLSRQAVQRIVNDLVKIDMLELHPDDNDKRSQKISITIIGQTAIYNASRLHQIWCADFNSRLYGVPVDIATRILSSLNNTEKDKVINLNTPKSAPDQAGLLPLNRRASKPPRAFEGVQQHILGMIREGSLVTGSKLPSERDLASALGLGRSAIREALRSLEMAGVLRFERGAQGGAFVKESSSDGITSSIRSMLILERLRLTDLLDVRATLLGQCARLGTELGTEEDFKLLENNIDELEDSILNYDSQIKSILPAVEFYRLAARTSHNPLLVLLVDAIAELVSEMLATLGSWPRMDSITSRHEMVAAMREGRADDAERVIRLHSQETNKLLIAYGRNLAM